MKNKSEFIKQILLAVLLLLSFAVFTVLVCFADRAPIGPDGSGVGMASINVLFRDAIGTNMDLYLITAWLGLVPIFVAFCFGMLGLVQWIKRKHILKVDADILALGVFYLLVMAFYILFEYVVINRRPVLIEGYLEASYPSSTTLLVLTVIPSAMLQGYRIKKPPLRLCFTILMAAFTLFMLLGRLISGVHWVSDIIGGVLLSAGLVMLYIAFFNRFKKTDQAPTFRLKHAKH